MANDLAYVVQAVVRRRHLSDPCILMSNLFLPGPQFCVENDRLPSSAKRLYLGHSPTGFT